MDLTARQAVLATVAVLALAVAAATLPDPVAHGGGGPTPVPEDGTGGGGGAFGSDDGGFSFGFGGGNLGFQGLCIPFLISPWFLTGTALALVLLAFLVYRRTDIIATVGLFGLFLPPAILVFLLLTDCRTPQPEPDPSRSPLPAYNISFLFQGNGTAGPTGGGSIPTTDPTFLLVLGALALVVVGIFLRFTGDDAVDGDLEDELGTEPAGSLEAVGMTAGRAADRIEAQAGLENEIFRAWREMTDRLDLPDPETTTPREFAARATAAGMDPEHVTELTRLFEESRYGGIAPTPARERRALEILRAIESAYADSSERGVESVDEAPSGSDDGDESDTEGSDAGS